MAKKLWTQTAEVPEALRSQPPPARVRAIEANEMGVAFQPIVDLETKEIFAAEMLARCRREMFANPAILFEQAELQGATGRLGRLTREAGFARAPEVPLFVNLHPHELSERWIVRPDDPMNFFEHGLFLEVTESAAFDYFELVSGALRELCGRLNAQLVVDDFGAGQSNLLRIAELGPAIVKLDRSLVMHADQHAAKQVILRHLVRLCEDLGARVVAEGIETVDELRVVIDAGVHYGQGYLLARPADPMNEVVWPDGI
ncbi:MAG: EAL domain-containing protein [Myxococcota bacterium]|nr:EAL domain-containing protein [Myxococcota bacterium]